MNSQLDAIVEELTEARLRLRALARDATEEDWRRRPAPGRWSIAECVAHLNLTSAAFLPVLEEGLERARQLDAAPPRRYRRDPLGWLLWKIMGPPVRFRAGTTAAFVPGGHETREPLVAEFERLQDEQIACAREADGLPIDRVRIASPVDSRVRYNLYAALTIIPRHQHRHLWQAEQARRAPEVRIGDARR